MHTQAPQFVRGSNDEISIAELWQIYRKNWVTIAAWTVVVGALTAAATFTMTPIYRAQTVIMEVNTGARTNTGALLGQFGGLAEVAGVDLDLLRRRPSSGRTLIQSRTFIEEFLVRNDLLPRVFPADWNPATGTWRADLPRERTVSEGAEEFKRRAFGLQTNPEPDLLTLSIDWTDAKTAADWANQLVALANELARQRDISDAERSVKYLNDQINQTNVVELQRVLYNLLEGELRTLILANAREDYAFQVIDRAVAPLYRVRPRRTFLTALGLVGGFLAGLGFVFVRRVPSVLRERASDSAST